MAKKKFQTERNKSILDKGQTKPPKLGRPKDPDHVLSVGGDADQGKVEDPVSNTPPQPQPERERQTGWTLMDVRRKYIPYEMEVAKKERRRNSYNTDPGLVEFISDTARQLQCSGSDLVYLALRNFRDLVEPDLKKAKDYVPIEDDSGE